MIIYIFSAYIVAAVVMLGLLIDSACKLKKAKNKKDPQESIKSET